MISVIVPVYNVEKYLPRCLQAISEQSYRDLVFFWPSHVRGYRTKTT